ncbi:MAG: MmgE/PrpD family protein [Proteobacteria bacterium]|nr:MmgE/PrpD family protein [Pseudomonadota bacterium]
MDATTERLVDYTLQLRYEDLSPAILEQAKIHLLDTLGCAAGAYDHPISIAGRKLAARYCMDTPVTMFGTGQQVSPEMGAFANSVMLRASDMNDNFRIKGGGHPSDIIGALFAGAELGARDGKTFLTALALGYKIYCSGCAGVNLLGKGWDQPVYGVVASALTVGKLIGLDRDQLGHAVALALVPNMAMITTRHGELSAWKGCAAANGARNGVFAALLAQAGFTGSERPFEGKHGLWDVVGNFEWPLTPGAPPERIGQTDLKAFPICVHGQTAVWVALDLRDRISIDAVEAIRIEVYDRAREMMDLDPTRWAPKTRETADHSLPYVVATALQHGAIDESAFSDDALKAPALAALMERITVEEDPVLSAMLPDGRPSRITITLKDGSEVQHEMRYQKGNAANPMSGEEVKDKFRGLFSNFAETAQAETVIGAVDDLENSSDISELIAGMIKNKDQRKNS